MTSEGAVWDAMQAGDTDGDFLDSLNWNTCSTLAGMYLSCCWKSVLFGRCALRILSLTVKEPRLELSRLHVSKQHLCGRIVMSVFPPAAQQGPSGYF